MRYEYHRYEGKVCVVTGAANGLGLNLTNRLIDEGALVAALDIEGDTLGKEFGARRDKILCVTCDVAVKAQVDDAVTQVVDRFGRIDVLFNNAGIIGRQSLLDTTEEQWRRVIDVNLNGVFFVAQAVLRHMVDREIHGVVVNTSSVASAIVSPNTGAYSASKGGVSMFTKFAALEMAKYGIRVCAYGPGTHVTRITEGTRNDPERCAMFLRNIPMGRFGEPDEATSVALFLGSDEASYCTGQTWIEDGGNCLF
ncbi:SDR family NAD(P)-dependent oxidoreductase [Pseudoflavonifractor phocaeensis]|uniref:SDR family NAD(P)-dependent oxidoreductase n=1 Tax=Pseudoflavonifractor phocaeensis TaxID=1870988 RepID=UPI00195EAE73|nr:glucose 1-dehydrogenase [Pseudoflavonifractor phocaeensis]MBM6927094.1 glucose 1-dehydrogenase [Pseudoflavonifractor phocaeensis]